MATLPQVVRFNGICTGIVHWNVNRLLAGKVKQTRHNSHSQFIFVRLQSLPKIPVTHLVLYDQKVIVN